MTVKFNAGSVVADFRNQVRRINRTFSPDILADMSLTVAQAVRRRWVRNAQQELGESKDSYIQGILPVRIERNRAVLALDSEDPWFRLWIEEGVDAWDMKEALLQGREYVDIPFISKRNKARPSRDKGAPLGAPFDARRRAQWVGGAVQRLASAELDTGLADRLSLRGPIDTGRGKRRQRIPILENRTTGYEHKANIYQDLQRHIYSRGTQDSGKYVTFRRISENSDPDSWMYPQTQGRQLLQHAIDQVAKDAAKQYLEGLLAGQIRVRRAAVSKLKGVR